MRDRTGVEERSVLRVTVDFTDPAHRCLGVSWLVDTAHSSAAADSRDSGADPEVAAAHRIFESARIFLVDACSRRTYLGLVDWRDRTSVQLPEALPAGSYAIDVDAYGSASWGDGRLDARGRSVAFDVEAAGDDQRDAAGS